MNYFQLSVSLLVALFVTAVQAQKFDEQYDHWPVNHRIRGKLMLAGQLETPQQLLQAFPGGDKPRTILITDVGAEGEFIGQLQTTLAESSQTMSEQRIENSISSLPEWLAEVDLLCWYRPQPLTAGLQAELIQAKPALVKFIEEGGSLIVLGPVADLCGKWQIQPNGLTTAGLNLLPDTIVELNYDNQAADRQRLLSALAARPRTVGVGLAKDTAIVLDRRRVTASGPGTATFLLMANERKPLRVQQIQARESGRQQPTRNYILDLTGWRRDAIDRTIDRFPPLEPPKPFVEKGSLVIVGGGGMPRGLMDRFVELAGGPEKARLVYVPCSESDEVRERQGMVETWKRMGVKQATFIHTKDREQANSDESFLEPLKDATGIWFGGGRQWNFADSYYGTKAHQFMKEVVQRGGVVGGSSAGASIQARYLARATPIENFQIMAPGYERGGLGFIGGVAIDQHFSQRGRQKDMTQLVNRYPQMLGIGLDEATAIIVQKSKAEVVGRGRVFFYDREQPVYPDRDDYIALPAGSVFDLANRTVVVDFSQADAEEPEATPAGEDQDDR